MMKVSAQLIADMTGGLVVGDANATVDGPCKIDDAREGKITFLSNPKYASYLKSTKASIVLVPNDFEGEYDESTTLIKVEDVYSSLALLMSKFNTGLSIGTGISAKSSIAYDVKIGDDTFIDDQVIIRSGTVIGKACKIYGQVFIGDNVTIGDGVTLYPGVKIYHNTIIGEHTIIHSNAVIGSDGFGFAPDAEGNYQKIAQIGNVQIGRHVEIGANTVIDRATMGSTIIYDGAKLDNLIQIAHNVSIGSRTVIAAQAGIAGSTKVGEQCMIGGQVGIVGHINIADRTLIQAQSGIASSVNEPDTKLYGSPAIGYQNYLKSYAHFRKLNVLVEEIRNLKTEIENLKSSKP